MPGFEHAVSRPLARDHPPIELPRQPDREIADVDHLLHFALALFEDLAGLDRYQPAERRLVLSQLVGKQPHQLAAARRRDLTPGGEGALGERNHAIEVFPAMAADRRDARAVNRG